MTTPGKNQSKRTPQRSDNGVMEEEEQDRAPMSNEESNELDDDEDDDNQDRIPEESVEDQETGRSYRDSDRNDRSNRTRGG